MNINGYVDRLVSRAAAALGEPEACDYIADGLLHCGRCHTPKQCRVILNDEERLVRCQCRCDAEQEAAEREEAKEKQLRINVKRMRETGVTDRSLRGCSFDAAEMTPELEKCRRYAENWSTMVEQNTGLLLWGGTGNGKTFAAACIANALIEHGKSAVMTSIPRILAAGFDEQADSMDRMRRCSLLVIDDLGAERSSDYALERVYYIIDERYKAKRPLIVTTNLTLKQFYAPTDMRYQRIYDRVLEMCVPMKFAGESIRRQRAAKNLEWAKQFLDGKVGVE